MIDERHVCRICGNDIGNRSHIARDAYYGGDERFEYFECAHCGAVQIAEVPEDIGKYYPQNYYSFGCMKTPSHLMRFVYRQIFGHRSGSFYPLGWLICALSKHSSWLTKGFFDRRSKILDVGCGAGERLLKMHYGGFKNTVGIDPFIEKDINYDCGLNILKQDISQVTEKFDAVMMHHSLEHIADQHETLGKANELLDDGGCLLVRIPVAGGYLWRKYGINMFNLDAPRHFILHTPMSITMLAKRHGFVLKSVKYEKSDSLIVCEKYQFGLKSGEGADFFTFCQKVRLKYSRKEARLHKNSDADCMNFYFVKQSL